MLNAILHTQIDYEHQSSRSQQEVAHILKTSHLRLRVEDDTGDATKFWFHGDQFKIAGIIQRWHGTESLIHFDAEITYNSVLETQLQNIRAVIIVALMIGSFFTAPDAIMRFLIHSNCLIFSSNASCLLTPLQILMPLLLIISAWCIGIGIILAIRKYTGDKRWQAQQAMGAKIDDIIAVIENK